MRKSVSDAELLSIVRAEIADADGQANSQISIERGENMDYYQGQPFGNEIEGRSSVVSSDVRDTIEWILPTLIRIFCSGENAVEFEPEQPNDTEAAKQATDYVNFIWNRDNRGFVNTYSWFKDFWRRVTISSARRRRFEAGSFLRLTKSGLRSSRRVTYLQTA